MLGFLRRLLRHRWVMVLLIGLVLVLGLFFGGGAWGYGRGYGDGYDKAQSAVKPVSPPPTFTSTPTPTPTNTSTPAPVNVIINPPIVNVTVSQTVNGAAAESDSSQVSPAAINFPEFKGLVYEGNFNTYKGIIEESVIDHTWGSGGPFGLTRFSVKWRGSVVVEESGRYRFSVLADDRVRLEVDDKMVIDKWVSSQPATEYTVDLDLAAGAHKIVLKYFNDVVGGSRIKLSCQRID